MINVVLLVVVVFLLLCSFRIYAAFVYFISTSVTRYPL